LTDKPPNWPWTGRSNALDRNPALRWHQVVRPRGADIAAVAM